MNHVGDSPLSAQLAPGLRRLARESALRRSRLTHLVERLLVNVRWDGVEGFELDSGVGGLELPVGSEDVGVAVGLPGCDLTVHLIGAVEAAVDALA